jgi:hypothetical protein
MKNRIRKALAAASVGGLIVVAAACQIEEHSIYRYCATDGSGYTQCHTRVGLNDQPDNGTQYARFNMSCSNGTLHPGPWRQIIGTTSDYGQGTSNPEWELHTGWCSPGTSVVGLVVETA